MNPNYTDIFGRLNYNDKRIRTVAHTVNNPPYKVYTALLTQSGGDNPQISYGDENISLGVTYTITANPNNYDLTIYGALNNNVGTSFASTVTINLPYDGSLVLSSNSGAPVVTVLENTIGNIWFIYQNIGTYEVISDALFIADKTTCITSQSAYNDTGVTFIYRDNVNLIYIETSDFFTQTFANDILAGTMLEIRVYN